jgi:hypothetical protein
MASVYLAVALAVVLWVAINVEVRKSADGSACGVIILTGGCEPGMRWLAKRDTRARR